MRHRKSFNHLGRKRGHRKALLQNMSNSLIEHKRIFTTLAKAKALRKHVEPIINKSKTNTQHSRRIVFKYLQNKFAVQELFDVIADKIADRPGGYTRVIKMGFRKSDGAELGMIELVDFNEIYDIKSGGKKKRRRGGKKKASSGSTETTESTNDSSESEE